MEINSPRTFVCFIKVQEILDEDEALSTDPSQGGC